MPNAQGVSWSLRVGVTAESLLLATGRDGIGGDFGKAKASFRRGVASGNGAVRIGPFPSLKFDAFGDEGKSN